MSALKLYAKLTILSLLFFTSSCVKDVDIDQAQEIVIPPEVALDLVYFTLDPTHFELQSSSGQFRARDVVRLEFLDDDYIKSGLMRADYNFIYTNTFEYPIISKISFLSESDVVMHSVQFEIPAGSKQSPATINYTEIIATNKIDVVRNSIKMIITLEMPAPSQPSEGSLQLKSKAFYEFEFK